VAESALEGQIALARKDYARAIEHLRAVVKAEDRLNYIEPADWYLPVRETLGHVQLLSGDATAAEATFRADLARNPRNPRSLLGLRESLRRQQKMHDAQCVDQEFRRAWQRTDQPELRLEDL
jgi:tetratricopeptide (TPR) repeat protein